MNEEHEIKLNRGFDYILEQLSHGNTIEGLKNGTRWMGLEKVKEWKSKFGYQFHIYSNDHLIEDKPHFHIVKRSEGIDCRLFFDGEVFDCKGKIELSKKIHDAIIYFVSDSKRQTILKRLWNTKNPELKVSV